MVAHPDVMDLLFQEIACRNKGPTPENLSSAKQFVERALAVEPENVEALFGLAQVDATSAGSFLKDDRGERFARAEAYLIRALSLVPEHAAAHLLLGFILISTKRAEQGIAECEQALALDRNLASAYGWMEIAKVHHRVDLAR
jgi:tetratricopeptide (TPR) repeat protein